MVKIPELGSNVHLKWVDAAEAPGWNYFSEPPKLYPRLIESHGTIVGKTALGIVLSAHVSEASTDGETGYLSLLAIPFGAILKVTRLAD